MLKWWKNGTALGKTVHQVTCWIGGKKQLFGHRTWLVYRWTCWFCFESIYIYLSIYKHVARNQWTAWQKRWITVTQRWIKTQKPHLRINNEHPFTSYFGLWGEQKGETTFLDDSPAQGGHGCERRLGQEELVAPVGREWLPSQRPMWWK